uniref:Putative secreted protein n=1 Tax=Anopheles triannulatus TaxID=58253 RepID=A0A2M4B5S8_9DIPT
MRDFLMRFFVGCLRFVFMIKYCCRRSRFSFSSFSTSRWYFSCTFMISVCSESTWACSVSTRLRLSSAPSPFALTVFFARSSSLVAPYKSEMKSDKFWKELSI